jgi:hypothetical protein
LDVIDDAGRNDIRFALLCVSPKHERSASRAEASEDNVSAGGGSVSVLREFGVGVVDFDVLMTEQTAVGERCPS